MTIRNPVYGRLDKNIKPIKLSILICTVPSRLDLLKELTQELDFQIQLSGVEYLFLGDNFKRSVGEKRQNLKDIANGVWIRYIDDDDLINETNIQNSLKAIKENQDKKVICFEGTQKDNIPFFFDRSYQKNMRVKRNDESYHVLVPNHLCIWKREVASLESFPYLSLSEDHRWAEAMLKHYTKDEQGWTDANLYHYNFNKGSSLCRKQ